MHQYENFNLALTEVVHPIIQKQFQLSVFL